MILGSHRASADLGSLEPGTHLCALEPDDRHLDRVAAVRAALPRGLALAGAAWDGVGIPACLRSGTAAAETLTAALRL